MPRPSPATRPRLSRSTCSGRSGPPNGSVSIFAINRAIEICIGIVCAGVVLALTDLGHSRRKLAAEFAALSTAIMDGFADCFVDAGSSLDQFQALRRDLLRRVIALDPMIDAAIGEASDLRYRSAALQRAVAGLMETLSAWRKVAFEIELNGNSATGREANAVHDSCRASGFRPTQPARPRSPRSCATRAARRRGRSPASMPRRRLQRLLADNAAAGMLGMARALNGLAGVIDPRDMVGVRGTARLHVPDWLPPFINAVRVLWRSGRCRCSGSRAHGRTA